MRPAIIGCLALPIICVGVACGQAKSSSIQKAIVEGCRSFLIDKLPADSVASKLGFPMVETSRLIVKYDAGAGVRLALTDLYGTRGCSVEVAVSDLDADRKAIADAFARWSPPLRRGADLPSGGYAVRDIYCAEHGNDSGLLIMRHGGAAIVAGVSLNKERLADCSAQ
jgi:hypothetical protein